MEASPSATPSETATLTPPPPPSTPYPPQAVLINEVAWAGTRASPYDEWIELHNPGPDPIDLSGWRLSDGGDINIALSGTLPAFGFFLLERSDDSTIADIPADLIYTGGLKNGGERLRLSDPSGNVVDTANNDGGPWPAGDKGSRASMERLGGPDIAGDWTTFSGPGRGRDAAGNLIQGTPRGVNSPFLPTPTAAPSPTPSPSPTPDSPATPYPPQSVLINEVAWAGTKASASDEWIELHNPGPDPIDLAGWTLTDDGDIRVALSGTIPAYGYFLLERTDDTTIADVPADLIYSGALGNGGERLWLRDPTGAVVDSANGDGGPWPAGKAAARASMERRGGGDRSGNWGTFTGYHGRGRDAAGNAIAGTPRGANSLGFPTPAPTWIPGRVVINEVLIRPHYDWEGSGGVSTADEFIELYNLGPNPVYLRGFVLDDAADAGSAPYTLPGVTVSPGGFAVFFRSRTRIALNDSGDTVRLLAPDGRVLDQVSYLRVRAYNLSYGRLPDGSRRMAYGLWPTPGRPNLIFQEPGDEGAQPIPLTGASPHCLGPAQPGLLLPRLARYPALLRWLRALGDC